jgi:hypothetical protein
MIRKLIHATKKKVKIQYTQSINLDIFNILQIEAFFYQYRTMVVLSFSHLYTIEHKSFGQRYETNCDAIPKNILHAHFEVHFAPNHIA